MRRVEPVVEPPVVSPSAWAALQELEGWLGNRKQLAAMMGRHWPTGALVALMYGPAGAGKATCASYMCARVGVPLYEVDVQKVMSKYIGEGIKQWDAVLSEAERRGCALLLKDAEGIFAPRVKVSRSADRYSNQEINFLLQRLEVFEGVLLLTSARASKMDSAFARRIQHRIELRMPEQDQRAELWRRWGGGAVRARGHHWEWLAEQELAPGDIQQAVLRALCAAKAQGQAPTVQHLWRAARKITGR
jgi:AAA+ superfamily predicted ATPase